jgi:single-stranded DNA-binding protein
MSAVIDALVSGHIFGRPTRRVGKCGKPFVTAKVRAGMRNGEAAFINLIAFTETVMTGLMALDNAAAVAVSGELTTNLWNDRDGKPHAGLDMVAHAILTAHHVDRRRKAARDQPVREPAGRTDEPAANQSRDEQELDGPLPPPF